LRHGCGADLNDEIGFRFADQNSLVKAHALPIAAN
jgi:hypothetical protein